MPTIDPVFLTTLTSCGGCASKAPPGLLAAVLGPLSQLHDPEKHPNLLVGLGVADDAAVYRINSTTAIVATLDFFAPLVDDPYTYGAIAAANALSDIFAMGGEVAFALNIAAFPANLPGDVIREIMRGGADKVAEAGGAIAGGHTIWDEEPKYGLSVIGTVHPRKLFSKAGLRQGDVLYLTKPLGVGTLISASRGEENRDAAAAVAITSALRLNLAASRLMREAGIRAATDVTGFGLLGHLWEMASRSGVRARIHADAVPLLEGALAASAAGFHTGGEGRNRDWVAENATFDPAIDPARSALLFDPQTSGGLLFGCARRKATVLEAAFAAAGEPLWRIGEVQPGEPAIDVVA